MKRELIGEIAEEYKVRNRSLFIEFLSLRFPNESDDIKSYFGEWAERFNKGNPEGVMDLKSLKIYNLLLDGYYYCNKCDRMIFLRDMNPLELKEQRTEGFFVCSNCINEEMEDN